MRVSERYGTSLTLLTELDPPTMAYGYWTEGLESPHLRLRFAPARPEEARHG